MRNFNPEELFYNSVVVDLETTGLYAGKDQILQLCAIKPTPRGPVVFNQYIYAEENPAYHINRINPDSLKNCPTEREVLQEFWAFVQDRDFIVSYNASFEMHFLEERSELHQLPHGDHAYICLMETFSDFFSTGWKKLPVAVRRCLGIRPFHDWAKTHQPHLKTKTLHKLLLYLIAYTLVPKIHFCTCKEVFSFFKYDLPKLKDRDRKKPRPLELY
jgi:DNA polymerase III epsilon subunit-like protein